MKTFALLTMLCVTTVAIGATPAPSPAAGAADTGVIRISVTTDRSHLLQLGEPPVKLAIANPNVADVNVVSPRQILINAKSIGVTSLVVFYPRYVQHIELSVLPAPIVAPSAPLAETEPHAVLVQRGDTLTNHLFVRDQDQRWLELGNVKLETDSSKLEAPKLTK